MLTIPGSQLTMSVALPHLVFALWDLRFVLFLAVSALPSTWRPKGTSLFLSATHTHLPSWISHFDHMDDTFPSISFFAALPQHDLQVERGFHTCFETLFLPQRCAPQTIFRSRLSVWGVAEHLLRVMPTAGTASESHLLSPSSFLVL